MQEEEDNDNDNDMIPEEIKDETEEAQQPADENAPIQEVVPPLNEATGPSMVN